LALAIYLYISVEGEKMTERKKKERETKKVTEKER
jgi:hypothetical protein